MIDGVDNLWPFYLVVSDRRDHGGGTDEDGKETKKIKVRQGGHHDIMQVEGLSIGNLIL